MGQALYRKHRPKKLSDVVGQEHITKTLSEALKQGRISHAYLLTGPRGVGKTSVARILAHEVNGLPYDDTPHIDIIEIDAASNRRIDEIRDLRDKVYTAPVEAKYKVYIIDEVHMLTREAFNALLKTLEEPPEHAIFILATTDAHKLPETIVSRTQRFSFKPVEKQAVVDHLAELAKQEKIKVSLEALALLAEHGEGSFRDSISMLDQAASQGGALEVADVQRLLGIAPAEAIEELAANLGPASSPAEMMQKLEALYEQGYPAPSIAKQLGQTLRRQLVDGASPLGAGELLELLARLIEVPLSHNPERLLEIVLLSSGGVRPASPRNDEPKMAAIEPSKPATAKVSAPAGQTAAKPESKAAPSASGDEPKSESAASSPPVNKPSASPIPLSAAVWPDVLKALKHKHNTIYSVVRIAEPRFTDEGLVLAFAFAFHQKRLKDAANQQILLDVIKELTGDTVAIEVIVDQAVSSAPADTAKAEPQEDSAELSTISNIFGGGELLES